MAAYSTDLFPALCDTLVWARQLAAPGDVSAALPLARLAALRGIAPRTLRDHLARLERLGLLQRGYAGQQGISLHVMPDVAEPYGPGLSSSRSYPSMPLLGDRWGSCMPDADCAGRAGEMAPANGRAAEARRLLTAAGVYPSVAAALAGKPWITPQVIAAWIDELSRLSQVRNLAAVLVYRLQDPARCLRFPGEARLEGTVSVGVRERRTGIRDGAALEAGEALAATAQIPYSGRWRAVLKREVAEAEPPCDDISSLADALAPLWARIRPVLVSHLGPDVDRVWLQYARPLSCSDGVLIISVPTALAAEWLNLSGAPRCHDAVQTAAGRPLLLRFVPADLRGTASD